MHFFECLHPIGLTLGLVEEPQSFKIFFAKHNLSSFKFSTKVWERDMLVNTPILEAYLHKFSTCVLANIKSFMFQSLLILFSVSIAVKFHLEHSTTQTIYTCRILLIFLLIIPLLHYPFLYNIANKAF